MEVAQLLPLMLQNPHTVDLLRAPSQRCLKNGLYNPLLQDNPHRFWFVLRIAVNEQCHASPQNALSSVSG